MKIKYRVIGQKTIWSPLRHTLIVGRSGTGKDYFGERLITKKIGRYKVIDLFSLERFEGLYYGLPNTDQDLIDAGMRLTGGVYKPTKFKHEIIMFYGHKIRQYHKLPKNIKLVSLRKEDIEFDDLLQILGTTDASKTLLFNIRYYHETMKEIGLCTYKDLESYIKKIFTKKFDDEEESEFFQGAHPATVSKLFQNLIIVEGSGVFHPGLPHFDVKEMMRHRDVITTTSAALMATDVERAIVMSIVIKKIVTHNLNPAHRVPIIVYFREIQHIFEKENEDFEFWGLARFYTKEILKEGRDNLITLYCNAQNLGQCKPILKYFSKAFALRLDQDDAKSLLGFAPIDSQTLSKLISLERGKGIFVSGGEYQYVCETLPPHHLKKKEGANVLGYLDKEYGSTDYSHLFKPKGRPSGQSTTPN